MKMNTNINSHHLYFDKFVMIYCCEENSSNSKIIEQDNLIKLIKSSTNNAGGDIHNHVRGYYKCAGIDKNNKKYTECSFSVDSRSDFLMHVRKNHKYLKLICLYCSDTEHFEKVKYFEDAISLVIHIEKAHKNLCFQCNLCPYRSLTPDNVNIHQLYRHFLMQKFIISCNTPKLNSNLTLKFFYDKFKTNYLKTDQYQCLYCEFSNYKFEDLIKHIVKNHPDYPLLYYLPFIKEQEKEQQQQRNSLDTIKIDQSKIPNEMDATLTEDEEDFLTDDDNNNTADEDCDMDENDNLAKNFCCFFCDKHFGSTDSVRIHLIKHLFKSIHITRNEFFDYWIDWFISSQRTYKIDSECPICSKLYSDNNSTKNNGVRGDNNYFITMKKSNNQIKHYIEHSCYKPFKCLLCKQNEQIDLWLPDIFRCISQHLNEFHKYDLKRFKLLHLFHFDKSSSLKKNDKNDLSWKQIKKILTTSSGHSPAILKEYSVKNDELFSSFNSDDQNALNVLESAYRNNFKSYFKSRMQIKGKVQTK